ncbi:MAG: hypothetical protein JWR37_3460 [Mycobacterium sp.]|jgi:hypothetical protein|nr:hypothetical protein [Mycobacterium sp.]
MLLLPAGLKNKPDTGGDGSTPGREGIVLHIPPARAEASTATAPIVMTEREVVFSTAATSSHRRRQTTHWLTDSIRVAATSVRHMLASPRAGHNRPARKHYPPRTAGYYERGVIARELDRL